MPTLPRAFIENFRVVLGTSFVAASLETMAFFAYLDPLMLGSKELPQSWAENRIVAYSVTFLLVWGLTIGVSALNAYLVQVSDPLGRAPDA